MAESKILAWIINLIGIPAAVFGYISNPDNIKSTILFIFGLSFIMLRGYFFFVERRQRQREKEIDLWHKEQDKQDRINSMKKNP